MTCSKNVQFKKIIAILIEMDVTFEKTHQLRIGCIYYHSRVHLCAVWQADKYIEGGLVIQKDKALFTCS